MITSLKYLVDSMNEQEGAIPALNQAPNADQMSHLSPQFNMGASIQSGQIDQSGQTDQSGQIDLSVSNIDMNDNIQINYPDTSNSNQWNDTGIFDNTGNDG